MPCVCCLLQIAVIGVMRGVSAKNPAVSWAEAVSSVSLLEPLQTEHLLGLDMLTGHNFYPVGFEC